MTVRIKVQAQLMVNKAINSDGDAIGSDFRPKGGLSFIFPVNSDDFMYMEEQEIVQVLSLLLEREGNIYERYEYRSHIVDFHEDTVIEGFDALAKKVLAANA